MSSQRSINNQSPSEFLRTRYVASDRYCSVRQLLFASQIVGISGVLAAVTAGLIIGHTGGWDEEPSQTVQFMKDVCQTGVFPVNTLVCVLIGELISPELFFDHAKLIVAAVVLVLLARAAVVYPLMTGINRITTELVPRKYQHVIVWGKSSYGYPCWTCFESI